MALTVVARYLQLVDAVPGTPAPPFGNPGLKKKIEAENINRIFPNHVGLCNAVMTAGP